jgi:hypothetical protein
MNWEDYFKYSFTTAIVKLVLIILGAIIVYIIYRKKND